MNGVKQLQEVDFRKEVLDADLPVLVDFFAPWCGPCRALTPVLEGVAKAYAGRLKVVKVNVDDAQQLAVNYSIRSVPTLMFFKEGEVVDTFIGLPPANALRAKLDAVASAPARESVCGCSV